MLQNKLIYHILGHTSVCLLLLSPSVSFATDCNACGYYCEMKCTKCLVDEVCYTDPTCLLDCKKKQAECESFASIISGHFNIVREKCANSSGATDYGEDLDKAKKIIIDSELLAGKLTADQINNVKFRWCNLNNIAGVEVNSSAITVSTDRIYLDDNNRGSSVCNLVPLIAHELYHVSQFHQWSSDGFKCRYAEQITQGHGTGERNQVEKPAYNFQTDIRHSLNLKRFCPSLYIPDPTNCGPGYKLYNGSCQEIACNYKGHQLVYSELFYYHIPHGTVYITCKDRGNVETTISCTPPYLEEYSNNTCVMQNY